jgi:divinyl chlorophyllide a 8-vinyl-reductase
MIFYLYAYKNTGVVFEKKAADNTTMTLFPPTVALTGASGTIGSATRLALERAGYRVMCLGRKDLEGERALTEALRESKVEAIISCMASRTGTRTDAWRVDHDAQLRLLRAAEGAGVRQFVLLSAICVQRPKLEFQRAKLAFEAALRNASICWTIVRPTAFFKSLSGQLRRVARGKPFLVFGDGSLTRCKPISDRDLAAFLVHTLNNAETHNAILPIGGPGDALSPLDQAALLSKILNRPVRVKHIPASMLLTVAKLLQRVSWLSPRLAEKAEYARIGHYYATESMLVWNQHNQAYDAEATPSWGQETLEGHYRAALKQLGY